MGRDAVDGDSAAAPTREPRAERRVTVLSGSPIADEYRFIERALQQCAPVAHRFERERYPPAAVAKARAFWGQMASVEYGSASTFIDIAEQARAIDAPI